MLINVLLCFLLSLKLLIWQSLYYFLPMACCSFGHRAELFSWERMLPIRVCLSFTLFLSLSLFSSLPLSRSLSSSLSLSLLPVTAGANCQENTRALGKQAEKICLLMKKSRKCQPFMFGTLKYLLSEMRNDVILFVFTLLLLLKVIANFHRIVVIYYY
jgi:hypothetical protein